MVGKIILASSSPRRADILKKINIGFEIIPSPYIEDHTKTVFSYDFIEDLAFNKAKAVVPLTKEPALIIGADTVVVIDNEILGKPDGYSKCSKDFQAELILWLQVLLLLILKQVFAKRTQQQVKLHLKILPMNRLNIILIILNRLTKQVHTEYKKCPKDI